MAMQSAEFVLSQMKEMGIHDKISGKRREIIVRNFKRYKGIVGLRQAQASLRFDLEQIKEGATKCE